MRHLAVLIGCFLAASLCNAATVQRRTYRNTEEILVPVAIIQDGEEIQKPADLKENIVESQINNFKPAAVIAEDIVAAVEEKEQKLEAVEAAVQAERRIDDAIIEEEIKEAVQEEQKKEIIEAIKEENKLSEIPEIISVIQSENNEAAIDPAKEVQQQQQNEKLVDFKPAAAEIPIANNESADNAAQQAEVSVRQATQATPAQTTPQPNVVQQFIQNSPLGQFFNSQNGSASAPFPTFPSLPTLPTFDPVAAATQALQGFQQFTTNLGNQFQNPFAGLAGQQQDAAANAATTPRPPGPIQQFVNSFSQQPSQSAPAQSGPLQNFLNLFQGNRPQESAATSPQPAKEPEVVDQTPEATAAVNSAEQASNALRDSSEAVDSFEESVQPNELIVVNDDASETENDQAQETSIV